MSRKTYKSNRDAKIACHVSPGQPPTHSQNRPTTPKNVNARWKSECVCTRACMHRCMYQRSHAHQKPNNSIAQTTGFSAETPHSRRSSSSSASSTRKDVQGSFCMHLALCFFAVVSSQTTKQPPTVSTRLSITLDGKQTCEAEKKCLLL